MKFINQLITPKNQPTSLLWLMALIIFWLLTHPYTGLFHDAVLYTAQTLNKLHPEHFKYDLFFQFGSQDSFSIYSSLYKLLITWFGVFYANLVCLIIFQALWLTGALRVTKNLLLPFWHWISLILITIMLKSYGFGYLFSYGEMFMTARLPAEAISLWAIALLLEQRKVSAFFLIFLAIAIHPLMGGMALAVMLLQPWTLRQQISIFLALTFITVVGFEFALFPKLLTQSYDGLWHSLLRERSPYLFTSLWPINTWSHVTWLLALTGFALRAANQKHKSFWSALLLAGLLCMMTSCLADLRWHSIFLIQIQTWRILWVLTLFQWIAICLVIQIEWHNRRWLPIILGLCWLNIESGGGWLAALLLMIVESKAYAFTSNLHNKLSRFLTTYRRYLAIPAIFMAFILWASNAILDLPITGCSNSPQGFLPICYIDTLSKTGLILIFVPCVIWLCQSKRYLYLRAGILLVAMAYGLSHWYLPFKTEKFLDTAIDNPALTPFINQVKPGDVVYWQGDLRFPWLLMRTAHYFSTQQAVGIFFNRETAIEAMRRSARLYGHTLPDLKLNSSGRLKEPISGEVITQQRLRFLCNDPILDFVALPTRYPDWAIAEYKPVGDYKLVQWLYDCRRLRQISP